MKRFLFLIGFSSIVFTSFSQKAMVDSAITIPFVGISYIYNLPGHHLEERFGGISGIGGQFGLKFKNGVYLGLKGEYLFGEKVKEQDVLSGIRTSEGGIVEIGGQLSDPIQDMEGWQFNVLAGYVYPLFGPNPNSGIYIAAGPGYFQHSIQIDYRDAQIPQLENQYLHGYDRLSEGVSLNEFIGYIHFGKRRLINFYAGFEFTQAWTKNVRAYNYNTRTEDRETRYESMTGFRIGWMVTLYRRAPEEFYYY